MTIDIVIPTYTINTELEDIAVDCVLSHIGKGRIIVVEDGGGSSQKLINLADIYLRYEDNVGFTQNVNRGWKFSDSEYTAIVSSDTVLEKGEVKDLCKKGKVTSPDIVNQDIEGLTGCYFVVHRSITDKLGMLNEAMKTYYSDEDYKNRTKDVFKKVNKVKIFHHQAKTVTAAGLEGNIKEDKKAFDKI